MRRTRIEPRWAVARWSIALSIATSALTATASLRADPAPERDQARVHFDRGVSLAKAQRFDEALREFQLAYELFPHFSVLYNIAQAQSVLGRPTRASAAFERYLQEGGTRIEPERRREVEAAILREREHTGTVEIVVDVDGAQLVVDDEPAGRSPLPAPIRVDAGPHRLKAMLDSGAARETSVEVGARQALSARLELRVSPANSPQVTPPPVPSPPSAALPPPRPRPAPPPATAPVVERSAHSTRRTLGYVLGGAGVALSAVALGHYLWNRGRYEDWQARSNDYYRDPTDQHREAANGLARSIPAASVVTVGLAIGAGVALSTGAVLLLSSPSVTTSGSQARDAFVSVRGEF